MSSISEHINTISQSYRHDLTQVSTLQELELVRIRYIGRNGRITDLMTALKNAPLEDRRHFGPLCNALKEEITQAIYQKNKELVTRERAAKEELFKDFDVTTYKPHRSQGSLHPYTIVIQEIEEIFTTMGFEILEGPEVETAFINFEALNIPEDHPARDMHDTFWLDIPGLLLRTHTSTVQIHALQNMRPPLAIVAPGRAYRHEATDASHDFMFMQCEGLYVDEKASLSDLFATAQTFLQAIFKKKDLHIRLRPGFFPFVEPGVEIDMSCPFCTDGCSTCKRTRWIEICGSGLVHPHVLETAGIDSKRYSGFAFGFGLTRLVMLKYGINDIRLLHEGKVDFLKQF